ncbi:3-deoxy-D-manno-octulosonic-acid transferase [Marinomonas sp. MED121]|uniref:3-deoxy-D-manno-octulosonic acid transferase n=1 Tax=Marinomonas sp. MED121 TaxID=314277 RepID=UPI0000690412|nr:3-deoxy-D-manno-octulosonic acid transferase [Marinomonas sp. MED121]EAQ66260.1 3-deoxy-D-manno-octulosonic-acid transferase [Marinomonas sp. MED121]
MLIYRILIGLISPFILLKLFKLGRGYPDYSVIKALGFNQAPVQADIWIHCASVGEVLAARPLVKSWRERHPSAKVLITTMTPTGAEQVTASFGEAVIHRYIPVDWGCSVKRFLKGIDCPRLLIIETELWPNLLKQVKKKGMALYVVNARLSDRSFKKYAKFARFSKELMSLPDCIYAHHNADAKRFEALGAKEVLVTGNIKFDLKVNPQVIHDNWQQYFVNNEFVWIAASTHEGEDIPLLDEHLVLKAQHPNAVLIIVPRHPQRFEQVYQQASAKFENVGLRSEAPMEDWHKLDVLVGDSMGEMMNYFQASDLAFVGGSLIERGGHNPIEPALLSKPVLVGNHTFNFQEITENLVLSGGGLRCKNAELVGNLLLAFAKDKALVAETGAAAYEYALSNQGAVERVLDSIRS